MLGPFKARGLPCLREVPWLVVWCRGLSLGLGLLSFFLLLLVCQGIEPNPGPGQAHCRTTKQLRVVCVNVGSASGLWRAFDVYLTDGCVDVLCVQECKLTDNEAKTLRAHANRVGYHWYAQYGVPGNGRWHGGAPRGGVGMFVRSNLPQRPAFASCDDNTQVVATWVCGWLLCSVYAPPVEGALGELGSMLLDMFAACEVAPSQQWLVCGDFNSEHDDCEVVSSLLGWGAVAKSDGRPSRWEGDRCLDWVLTNRCLQVSDIVPDLLPSVTTSRLSLIVFMTIRRPNLVG